MIFEREIKDPKMSSFSSDFQTLIKHYFPLYFLYELLLFKEFENLICKLMLFFNFAIIYFQLIQELKKENFDLKLRLYMEQKEREVSHCGVGVLIWSPFRGRG